MEERKAVEPSLIMVNLDRENPHKVETLNMLVINFDLLFVSLNAFKQH